MPLFVLAWRSADPGAASVPFGFGHAVRAVQTASHVPRLIPPFWQLVGFSAFFAGGGYIIDAGDTLNGAGVVTGASSTLIAHSAWSLTYVTFNTLFKLPWLARSPLALLLSTAVGGVGLGVYGNYYFDQQSWRGAVPGLLPPRKAASGS